ncbi:endo-beta-N-acetylglucosaminidase H [Nesterenkonia sp. HG001]|uniref:endo-beta-N-acetylglucosaminidase H n=1 Tax=Nesterenkonia sp. HG001 TaxID=2983207 RepID=UPI002AC47CD6|nr:endo-beta-N-acetylglucosaminidase H [Nesterenkonia sp. HG001]MDZ5076519.1 glycosyl hydrolase family 18 protein [Nesterenkonia sp. HG001]
MTDNPFSRRNALRAAGAMAAGGLLAASAAASASAAGVNHPGGRGQGAGRARGRGRPPGGVKTGPGMVCYVEVNDHSMTNLGKYRLAESGADVFDIGIIFASNINSDGDRAVLHHNEQVTAVLENVSTEVRPLQRRGMKILLSILGNHQGVGPANFQTYEEAVAFAAQLADTVHTYGLDGIDFDDEWARYDLGHPPNDWSFPYLVHALRARMPGKIISLYWYGPITETLEYDGIHVGELIDYSWNSMYGTWLIPEVPGLSPEELAPAAVNISATDDATDHATAASLANRTVAEGYGLYNTYDLQADDASASLTAVTTVLNGEATVYSGRPG